MVCGVVWKMVLVRTNNDPFNTLIPIISSDSRNWTPFTSFEVLDLVSFPIGRIDSSDQTVLCAKVSESRGWMGGWMGGDGVDGME